MKKALLLIFALTLILALYCGAAQASGEPWNGSGTEADPWRITSAADLVALREYVAAGENTTQGKHFRQMADISLSPVCGEGIGDWTPIGYDDSDGRLFIGTYDGTGKTISGLYIGNGGKHAALFAGLPAGSNVKNLTVSGYIKGAYETGGIAGWNKGTMTNSHFSGTAITTNNRVGGIAGFNGGTIKDCTVNGVINGLGSVGGIAGFLSIDHRIVNCSFIGTVTGTYIYVGGIVGYSNGTISGCVVEGNVSGSSNSTGGIVGCNYQGKLSDCTYQNGTVSGPEWVGGIAGLGNAELIENCKSYGAVQGNRRVGGITGETCGPIRGCENHGPVTAIEYVGGIAGHTFSGLGYIGTVEDCKNYGTVTSTGDSGHYGTDAGGIVGYAEKDIIRCENHGQIQGDNYVGGIVGCTDAGINCCTNDGQIIGERNTGSIAGYSEGGTTVILKANGGSGSDVNLTDFTAPACPFTRNGYAFLAWNTAPDGSGTFYPENDGIPHQNELTLYAIWIMKASTTYRPAGGGSQTVDASVLRSDLPYLFPGWYTASADISFPDRLVLTGNVNLILPDGITITCTKGIRVPSGSSLTIWSQTAGSGMLVAVGEANCAGIGGNKGESCGTVNIHGGTVTATGGSYGAGIGGGDTGAGGTVIIHDGAVTATGREGAAGIGGGDYGNGGNVTINGGSVTANGSTRSSTGQASAGIGAGRPKTDGSQSLSGGSVAINGGYVLVWSGGGSSTNGASAIGANFQYSSPGELTIAGGLRATPPYPGSSPVGYSDRVDLCRTSAVLIEPCTEHQYVDLRCVYCESDTPLADYFEGEGSVSSPYLIRSEADWNRLVELNNNGHISTDGFYFRLTGDITVSTMLGTDDHPFRCVYDGGGKTMTLRLSPTDNNSRFLAPFRRIENATIRNLKTTGTVSGGSWSAGLIGAADGTNLIENCLVDVSVAASGEYAGGILGTGHSSSTTIQNCAFTGSISGGQLNHAGTIWGMSDGNATAEIVNCLDLSDSPWPLVLSLGALNSNSVFYNNYRTRDCEYSSSTFNAIPGDLGHTVTAGNGVVLDFRHKTLCSVSGIAILPKGLSRDGIIYLSSGESCDLILTSALLPGHEKIGFAAGDSILQKEDSCYQLDMQDSDITITCVPLLNGSGSAGDPWQISSADDWNALAACISAGYDTAGMDFALTADIAVTSMLGAEASPFSGTFNGSGKTLTVNLDTSDSSEKYTAPFHYIRGAVIRNLNAGGTVKGKGRHSGGLVGSAGGTNLIENCRVAVSNTNLEKYAGGILGHGERSTTTLRGCVFSGSISGSSLQYAGTLWGWSSVGATAVVEDCLDLSGSAYPVAVCSTSFSEGSRFENVYYTFADKAASSAGPDGIPGRQAYSVTAGGDVSLDFGEGTEYAVSGITAHAAGLVYGNTFFAGEAEIVSLGLSCEAPEEGYLPVGYTAGAGTLMEESGVWTLTMPGQSVVISAVYAPVFGEPDFTLPAFLTAVEEEAFEGIAASVIAVPAGCASIGDHAFRNCPRLTQIRVPADCELGQDVFDGCELVYIYSAGGSAAQVYCGSHENCVFVEIAQDQPLQHPN